MFSLLCMSSTNTNTNTSTHLLAVLRSEILYKSLSFVPGIRYSPSLMLHRGASFRTERFPEFARLELQQAAAKVCSVFAYATESSHNKWACCIVFIISNMSSTACM
jgi:hypothetical protein